MSGTTFRISPPEPGAGSLGSSSRSRLLILLCTAVLLVVGLELSLHADSLSVWSDEMWSIFHSSKNVAQILQERDITWPFGSYLVLHGWMQLAGSMNDFVLRALGVFSGILAAALLIRAGQILRMPLAGLLAALAFGTSSYALSFSLDLHGYGVFLLLVSAFICVYLRWWESSTLRRSLPLTMVMILMLYVHFISGLIFGLATLHLLCTRPRQIGRWVLQIAVAAIAFIPLVPQAWRAFNLTSAARMAQPLPQIYRLGLDTFYRTYSAHWDLWFAIVLAFAAIGLVRSATRLGWQTAGWLIAWGIGVPLVAYAVREHFAFFLPRYLVFTLPPSLLVLGVGLGGIPKRWIGFGLLAVLALAPWQPFDFRPSYADAPPVRDLMREMAQAYRPGDRLVVDPRLSPLASSLEWAYYKSIYLPQADLRLDEQGTPVERRVWYLYRQGTEDPDVEESVRLGRVPRTSWGPWYLHASLFEAPPSDTGTPFGRALRFLGADVDRLTEVHAGDTLPIRLWWVADIPTTTDFSVDLEICDAGGRILAHTAGSPVGQAGAPAPGTLRPGEILLDTRSLQVPYHLTDGLYSLQISVGPAGDSLPLPAGGDSLSIERLMIDQFHIISFAEW